MQKLMTPKHVAIQSSTQTDCAESVTNRFQLDEQGRHWPARTTRLKQSHKTHSLGLYTQVSNCAQLSNTHSQSESCLSCNSGTKRHQSKRVAHQLKEKEDTQPNNCGFSLYIRQRTPCSGQAVSLKRNFKKTSFFVFRKSSRTSPQLAPFQMHTFQSLSVPKPTHGFTKTRLSTVPCNSPGMVQRVIHRQNQHSKGCSNRPAI